MNPIFSRYQVIRERNMMTRLKIALALLAFALLAAVSTSPVSLAQGAQLCTDGQSMDKRPSCICRPPLKYLPGNICGSGAKKGPTTGGTIPGHKLTTCQPGMNSDTTGCVCRPPLQIIAAGRCDRPPRVCVEGQKLSTGCRCLLPLRRSMLGACIRCVPGDGDRVDYKGRCHQNIRKG